MKSQTKNTGYKERFNLVTHGLLARNKGMNNLVLGMTVCGQTWSPICRFVWACVGASALYCGLRRLVSSDTGLTTQFSLYVVNIQTYRGHGQHDPPTRNDSSRWLMPLANREVCRPGQVEVAHVETSRPMRHHDVSASMCSSTLLCDCVTGIVVVLLVNIPVSHGGI